MVGRPGDGGGASSTRSLVSPAPGQFVRAFGPPRISARCPADQARGRGGCELGAGKPRRAGRPGRADGRRGARGVLVAAREDVGGADCDGGAGGEDTFLRGPFQIQSPESGEVDIG